MGQPVAFECIAGGDCDETATAALHIGGIGSQTRRGTMQCRSDGVGVVLPQATEAETWGRIKQTFVSRDSHVEECMFDIHRGASPKWMRKARKRERPVLTEEPAYQKMEKVRRGNLNTTKRGFIHVMEALMIQPLHCSSQQDEPAVYEFERQNRGVNLLFTKLTLLGL
jgi:hypothetical protein